MVNLNTNLPKVLKKTTIWNDKICNLMKQNYYWTPNPYKEQIQQLFHLVSYNRPQLDST